MMGTQMRECGKGKSIENYELDRLWREKEVEREKRVCLFIVTDMVPVGLDASVR